MHTSTLELSHITGGGSGVGDGGGVINCVLWPLGEHYLVIESEIQAPPVLTCSSFTVNTLLLKVKGLCKTRLGRSCIYSRL